MNPPVWIISFKSRMFVQQVVLYSEPETKQEVRYNQSELMLLLYNNCKTYRYNSSNVRSSLICTEETLHVSNGRLFEFHC